MMPQPSMMPPSGMASGMESAPPAGGAPGDLQALLALLMGQEGPGNLPTPPAAGLGGPAGMPGGMPGMPGGMPGDGDKGGDLLSLLSQLLGGAGSSAGSMPGCY